VNKKSGLEGRNLHRWQFMHRRSDVDCPGLNLGLHWEKMVSKILNHCVTFLDLATGTNITDTVVNFGMNICPLEAYSF
jgi:hypothetical protein